MGPGKSLWACACSEGKLPPQNFLFLFPQGKTGKRQGSFFGGALGQQSLLEDSKEETVLEECKSDIHLQRILGC